MTLLVAYISFALVFSFLCYIAEAVMLSVTPAYIAVLEKSGRASGVLLRRLKDDINKPLAAILTLNTIAHTIGAAGAGAQVAVVFGNAYLGIASAILTLLILIFSEIIPKTLGAHHWRRLAPATAYGLKVLIWLLYPFVIFTERLTRGLAEGPVISGFSRKEFAAMAELSKEEGQLAERETEVLKNLLRLRDTRVKDAMTPRTVMFSVPEAMTVEEFFAMHSEVRFSRIPVFSKDPDYIEGFVLRSDLLLAHASGETNRSLESFRRTMPVLPDSLSLARAFNEVLRVRAHIAQVVDEFGSPAGILTLEDILETLLGLEIVDEGDTAEDMQGLARKLWKRRAQEMGLDFDGTEESGG
ncbi:MAG: HlyC/CorC family transporter [Xanthomonadales bacterium]|nr:HlyC/CorC family transporter [Xanthomonadales bacterium]